MISALTLLMATKTAAPIQVPVPVDPLAAIVERSNRIQYDLPEVRVEIMFAGDESKTLLTEARRGAAKHGRIFQNDLLAFEFFGDGKRNIALQFGDQTYRDDPSGDRETYDKANAPLPPLDEDRFDLNYETARGLILRSRPAITIVKDEPKTGDEGFRRITARAVRPAEDGTPDGTFVDFRVSVDATGLIRRVEGEAKSKDTGAAKFLYTCEPKVAADEVFTYDVARLTGWTKIEDPKR